NKKFSQSLFVENSPIDDALYGLLNDYRAKKDILILSEIKRRVEPLRLIYWQDDLSAQDFFVALSDKGNVAWLLSMSHFARFGEQGVTALPITDETVFYLDAYLLYADHKKGVGI
ncbi:MAG: hypothetical protein OXE99_00365, partial [Cellvibrionales bacterium]|nr:hypothetical protein [Cellvibrionales bacterium]